MTPNSPWRLIGVAMLLVGSCLSAHGQMPPAKPASKPVAAPAAGEQLEIDQVVNDVIGSKSKPMTAEELRKAIEQFSELLKQNPNKAEVLVARAGAYVRLEEMQSATSDITQALKLEPNNATAWYVYAQVKIDVNSQLGDVAAVKEGIAALKKSRELGLSDSSLFLYLGMAHQKLGDHPRAIAAYTKAIEQHETSAYIPRAMLRSLRGEWQEAIADLDRAIEAGNKGAGLFYERGRANWTLGNHGAAIKDFTRAIEEDPKWFNTYMGRAQCYEATGNLDLAIKDYDRAIELQPTELMCFAWRGCAHIARKDFHKGIDDIRSAIRLNNGDAGANYQPTTDKKLSIEALTHGEKQVRKLLKDRPAMAKHVKPGDKLWNWAARKFAGEDIGKPIDWDAEEPHVFLGVSVSPKGDTHGRIRIAARSSVGDRRPLEFDELWNIAVFEIHNFATSTGWSQFDEEAYQGKLTCDQYVEALNEMENTAVQRTRAFYISAVMPWSGEMTDEERGASYSPSRYIV